MEYLIKLLGDEVRSISQDLIIVIPPLDNIVDNPESPVSMLGNKVPTNSYFILLARVVRLL